MARTQQPIPVVLLPFTLGHVLLHIHSANWIHVTTHRAKKVSEASVVFCGRQLKISADVALIDGSWQLAGDCQVVRSPLAEASRADRAAVAEQILMAINRHFQAGDEVLREAELVRLNNRAATLEQLIEREQSKLSQFQSELEQINTDAIALQFAGDSAPPVPAECHSDDHVVEAKFDARIWLAQATDEEILRLARCEWANDYPADEVAQFMRTRCHALDRVFRYLEFMGDYKLRSCGFECWVNGVQALEWLRVHRPQLVLILEGTQAIPDAT